MRTLKFVVDDQILKPDPSCNFNNLVPGGKECVKLEFSFSSNWNGYARGVEFSSALGKQYTPKVLVDGRSCIVPVDALARRVFKVRVVGKKKDETITTNKFAVKQSGGEV